MDILGNLNAILDNQYIKATLTIIVLMYASSIGPDLPSYIKVLFNNPIFRILFLFLIVMKAERDPLFALSLSILFVLILSALSQQQAKEAFKNI